VTSIPTGSSRRLWSFRYLVQCTLLNKSKHPTNKEVKEVSNKLYALERFADFGAEDIRCTKILRVLEDILKLANIPQEFQLKKRISRLLKKLTQHEHLLKMQTRQRSTKTLRRSMRIIKKYPRRSTRMAKRRGKQPNYSEVAAN